MSVHHVEPISAYTFSFGPTPALCMLAMSRLTPVVAVAGSYAASAMPVS
jgi:hypothetical protein